MMVIKNNYLIYLYIRDIRDKLLFREGNNVNIK